MECPKCKGEMQTKTIDEVEIDICASCGGIFLDDGEFESFTGIDPATGFIRLSRFAKVLTKLNERAILDELTEVYTRKYFNEFMDDVFENKNHGDITLIAIDIDHFKQVNTDYGHDGGDAVLKTVATTIKNFLRTSRDDYIFRLGGEEFAIVLFNLSPDDSYYVAEAVRKIIQSTEVTLPSGEKISVTISLGVALSRSTDTKDTLYKRSDELLYDAKNSGRNRVVMEKA
jgi:diguanylate cyclase (GGDEF)-like protein